MSIKPLGDRLIIKRTEEVTKTQSGIFIPNIATEQPDQGTVIAAGPGRTLESGALLPLNVAVGDVVLFGRHAGQIIKIKGEDLLVMRQEEIMAIIEA